MLLLLGDLCRAFRLYLSSKYGKTACLRLTNRFGGAMLDPQAAFHDLLISVLHSSSGSNNTPLAAASLPCYQQQQRQLVQAAAWQCGQGCAQRGRGGLCRPVSLLRVEGLDWQQELQQLPLAWQQIPVLQLNPVPHNPQQLLQHDPQQDGNGHLQQQRLYCQGAAAGSPGTWQMGAAMVAGAAVCHGPSPYPHLEHFITSVCVQVRCRTTSTG